MGRSTRDFIVPYINRSGDEERVSAADMRNGVDDETVRQAFKSGHCHGLACQINELGGHPIGRVTYHDPEGARVLGMTAEQLGDRIGTLHYFNYDKNDPKFGYDIEGRRRVEDILTGLNARGDSSNLTHERVSNKQFHEDTSNPNKFLPINHTASAQVARHILAVK